MNLHNFMYSFGFQLSMYSFGLRDMWMIKKNELRSSSDLTFKSLRIRKSELFKRERSRFWFIWDGSVKWVNGIVGFNLIGPDSLVLGLRRVRSTKDLNWRKKTLQVDRSVVLLEVWVSLINVDVDNQNHITCNVVVLGNLEPSSTPILFNNGTGATWLWITLLTIDKTLTQFKLAYDNANLYNTIESSEIIPSIYIFSFDIYRRVKLIGSLYI